MTKDNVLELQGVVTDVSNGKFRVQVMDNLNVLCTLSGKMRIHNIRIILGDQVKIEVSPYDLTKGRISYRFRD